MSTNRSHTWINETGIPFVKSIAIAFIFSPWLLIAYPLLTNYTSTLTQNDQDVIRGFIEWFGTAYSFFLALAVVNVWQQFDTVDREFDRELDAVATLRQTVRFTRPSNWWKQGRLNRFREVAEDEIRKYIQHVITYHKLEHKVPQQQRNGNRILETIGNCISDLISEKIVPEPFVHELFQSLNEAMDVRGDRISHAKPYTPPVVNVVSFIASVTWLLSFLGLVIYDRWVQIFLIGGVAFVIIMVLVIFFDLGEPFGGIWKIHLDDWQEFLDMIDHDEDPKVIFIYSLQSTALGWLSALTRRETCKLHDFAHLWAYRGAWKQFQANLQRPRAEGCPRIACRAFYSDQLNHYGLTITEQSWPLVILKRGDAQDTILDSGQINSCTDLTEFVRRFHQNLQQYLPGYD